MSTSNKIRSLQKKKTALWAKYKQYEDRLEALDARYHANTTYFWSYATGSDSLGKEGAGLRSKMSDVMSDISRCENEIKSIREGAGSDAWHSEVWSGSALFFFLMEGFEMSVVGAVWGPSE